MHYRYKKWNESGFRPPLCTYRLNWARRTSWGWWDDWDDTVLQTQDSKFEPWRSEAEHATSRSRRLPTILTFTRGWGRNIFYFFQTAETGNRTPNSGVKGSGANHYPRAPAHYKYSLYNIYQHIMMSTLVGGGGRGGVPRKFKYNFKYNFCKILVPNKSKHHCQCLDMFRNLAKHTSNMETMLHKNAMLHFNHHTFIYCWFNRNRLSQFKLYSLWIWSPTWDPQLRADTNTWIFLI